ncbi:MAG: lytic transglycosylase domain-containing protein [Tropicimonas sp.]|uniref:lytic murein transglycosylase n=1 Tax=Tropicimonas sp. TaxID=2067044 RepID=UPI003A8590C0
MFAACVFSGPSLAAQCGQNAGGYDAWKQAFAKEAAREGIGKRGLAALAQTRYAQSTINADRGQKSFKYSFEKFCEIRGCNVIVSQGRKRKAQNPGFYSSLEKSYGVPAGVLIAIHGMETGFGRFMGDSNVLSATATLAYDCRRPAFFRPHLIGALKLIDAGMMSPNAIGAKHGELGHTQFLPGNAYLYGRDGNGDGRIDLNNQSDALASTANYLRQKGWRPGQDYQPGSHNYRVLQEWNAASVYQQSLAVMGAQIDR